MLHILRRIAVNRPRHALYEFWRDLGNLPRFMEHLDAVTMLDQRRARWVIRAPSGAALEWDAEIVADEPGRRIAWRAAPDSAVPNLGTVTFADLPDDGGTDVRVEFAYEPKAGPIGAAAVRLFGEEPRQQLRADLRRFKSVVEAEVG
jgi:uncharacterized membrane protein